MSLFFFLFFDLFTKLVVSNYPLVNESHQLNWIVGCLHLPFHIILFANDMSCFQITTEYDEIDDIDVYLFIVAMVHLFKNMRSHRIGEDNNIPIIFFIGLVHKYMADTVFHIRKLQIEG